MLVRYRCNDCDHEFQTLLLGDKVPGKETTCPECGSLARRCPSRVSVQYSGEGFTKSKKEKS